MSYLLVPTYDWLSKYSSGESADLSVIQTTFQTSTAEDNIQLDKDIEALREGCPDRRLWFAGEHTAPFVALGTTTGAYWSGEAVADRIVKAYGTGLDRDNKYDPVVNGVLKEIN